MPDRASEIEALLRGWALDDGERIALCGHDESDEEQAERLRRLRTIVGGLYLLFPENPELRQDWVQRKNGALGWRSPAAGYFGRTERASDRRAPDTCATTGVAVAPTYLFLDTEWADAAGAELVSLALISEDGRHHFYAECAKLPAAPTPFVAETVYPRLERGRAALEATVLREELRSFLGTFESAYVLADYPNDIRLLRAVLTGDGTDPRPLPSLVTTAMDKEGSTAEWVEAWFRARPHLAARRHHALVDAQALRMAWRVATGRISAEEWHQADSEAAA